MIKMTETPRSAYLVDFGITKMGDGNHTSPVGMFLGTPDYASPEQISGAQALDRRADVYSLACTAFHTLTGRPPYGDAPSDAARISAHLQAPVPSARALRPELPEGVDAVFAKALAKNRDDRYASCSEFVRDLRGAFPTAAHEFRRALPPGAELAPPSLYGPEVPPRRKWPFVVIGVAVAVLRRHWRTSSPTRSAIRRSRDRSPPTPPRRRPRPRRRQQRPRRRAPRPPPPSRRRPPPSSTRSGSCPVSR